MGRKKKVIERFRAFRYDMWSRLHSVPHGTVNIHDWSYVQPNTSLMAYSNRYQTFGEFFSVSTARPSTETDGVSPTQAIAYPFQTE